MESESSNQSSIDRDPDGNVRAARKGHDSTHVAIKPGQIARLFESGYGLGDEKFLGRVPQLSALIFWEAISSL